jgi:hypothetical protein
MVKSSRNKRPNLLLISQVSKLFSEPEPRSFYDGPQSATFSWVPSKEKRVKNKAFLKE